MRHLKAYRSCNPSSSQRSMGFAIRRIVVFSFEACSFATCAKRGNEAQRAPSSKGWELRKREQMWQSQPQPLAILELRWAAPQEDKSPVTPYPQTIADHMAERECPIQHRSLHSHSYRFLTKSITPVHGCRAWHNYQVPRSMTQMHHCRA